MTLIVGTNGKFVIEPLPVVNRIRLHVLGISQSNTLLPALSFRVFESRLFSGGEPREFEPSQAIIDDVTGDGADDLILLCHDRALLYPQMTEDSAAASQQPPPPPLDKK